MDMQSGAQKETIEEDVKKNVTKCFAFDEDLAWSVCLASPCECVWLLEDSLGIACESHGIFEAFAEVYVFIFASPMRDLSVFLLRAT